MNHALLSNNHCMAKQSLLTADLPDYFWALPPKRGYFGRVDKKKARRGIGWGLKPRPIGQDPM